MNLFWTYLYTTSKVLIVAGLVISSIPFVIILYALFAAYGPSFEQLVPDLPKLIDLLPAILYKPVLAGLSLSLTGLILKMISKRKLL